MTLARKNVLVTGGAGFIGSALVRELVKKGANTIVYDNFSSGDISNLREIQDSIKVIKGDAMDSGFRHILRENDVEYVFHLAAEPYIPKCYHYPERFFQVNALGTLRVLNACKEVGVKRVLHYSTSEVYGTAKYVPMDEEHPTRPLSTYAVSKLAADRICYTMYHEHNVPTVILRQFNVYGPRETQPYVIPEIITQLSKSEEVKLGNTNARRDFTYVEDAVKGALALIENPEAEGEVVNLGTGKDYSIRELVHITSELMECDSVEIIVEPERLRVLDVELLRCDYSKARKLIGWKPEVDIREGLRRTIKWFQEHGSKWIWEEKIAPEERVWKGKL